MDVNLHLEVSRGGQPFHSVDVVWFNVNADFVDYLSGRKDGLIKTRKLSGKGDLDATASCIVAGHVVASESLPALTRNELHALQREFHKEFGDLMDWADDRLKKGKK